MKPTGSNSPLLDMLLDLSNADRESRFVSSPALVDFRTLLSCVDGYTLGVWAQGGRDREWEQFIAWLDRRLGSLGTDGWQGRIEEVAGKEGMTPNEKFIASLKEFRSK